MQAAAPPPAVPPSLRVSPSQVGSQRRANIANIPTPVLENILTFLDARSVEQFGATNKMFRDAARAETLWSALYRRDFRESVDLLPASLRASMRRLMDWGNDVRSRNCILASPCTEDRGMYMCGACSLLYSFVSSLAAVHGDCVHTLASAASSWSIPTEVS